MGDILTASLRVGAETCLYAPIGGFEGVERLPFSLRVALENLARQRVFDRRPGVDEEIEALLNRQAGAGLNLYPTRIFGQDILGQVMLVDLAALRDAVAEAGGDPKAVNPVLPVDIVIDHSVQIDAAASPDAARINLEREYARNAERFGFLRWAASNFDKVRVAPPGKGIMHQIHLEHIARVVWDEDTARGRFLSCDMVVGVDSHTPMINALGVLGWGVGGLEAEAVMLGKPISIALPPVLGIELVGRPPEGVMPTDVVLAITRTLRELQVVGEFVEFFGPGLDDLPVGDRGTIANMAPEYGATAVYFPIDARTIDYLRRTGRAETHVATVEAFARAQCLWRDRSTPTPAFDRVVRIDLSTTAPCIAGPRKPEDYIPLAAAAGTFDTDARALAGRPRRNASVEVSGAEFALSDGDIVIAAITSCTNTSNPTSMIGAGLLARNAAAKGLRAKPWVKTSLAPGSHAAAAALRKAGLQEGLNALGFHVAAFGCTTCNGGSGPLPDPIIRAIEDGDVLATAVLSGNRNFQGRIHPNVRAAYLASPALVVAYAIAGSIRLDLTRSPLGDDRDGAPVLLADIWPTSQEIGEIAEAAYTPDLYAAAYEGLFDGGPAWAALEGEAGLRFGWSPASTYLRRPPYFEALSVDPPRIEDLKGLRPLAILGDSVTTDDISPSGAISLGTPAADFLLARGVARRDFNNYTTRRGNHEIIARASFANTRLRNLMVPGVEGGFTKLQPEGSVRRIFEAAAVYAERGAPLVVIAGRNYGCGSSRDSAAKGLALLGVRAVIAESFERIHRANLVGMGILPLEFLGGQSAASLGLEGSETFDILGLTHDIALRQRLDCVVRRADGEAIAIVLEARLDTLADVAYWRHGGILPSVWRDLMQSQSGPDIAPQADGAKTRPS